jgi:tetratricopeptide (TPR) repeat protein
MGRYEESITELKRASRLDPHSIVNQNLGYFYFSYRRYDQAIEQFEKALDWILALPRRTACLD